MKVELEGKHWGLISTLRDILKNDHEVSVVEAKSFPAQFGLIERDWEPDVHISTFPYEDVNNYDKKVPIILYATDPTYEWVIDGVREIQKWEGCSTVAAEPCYEQTFWPIKYQHEIPFAINMQKYYPWTGGTNKVAVVNRKAESRFGECVRGATGIPYTLKETLGDIPFDIFTIDNNDEYRKQLAKYDVMFYFSNSPYTLVMFEGMHIGMPMVGYNSCQTCIYKPIEKYLKNYSVVPEEIRTMLKAALANPQKETYPVESLDEVRQKWNKVIKDIYDRNQGL